MYIRSDFHLHTELSVDAEADADRLVRRAIELGLRAIAITDHADQNAADEGAGLYDPQAAYAVTQRLRARYGDDIVIRHGVELGEPDVYARQYAPIYASPVDVVIGSVHYVGSHGVHADYFDVFDVDEAIEGYFESMLTMVEQADIDVLGHLDYFERYTAARGLAVYQPDQHRGRIERILEVIIAREIALEVNTSGYRNGLNRFFPHSQVLRWYRHMSGSLLSLGSDAHRVEQVGCDLDRAATVLKAIGFKEYHVFCQRQSQPLPLAVK